MGSCGPGGTLHGRRGMIRVDAAMARLIVATAGRERVTVFDRTAVRVAALRTRGPVTPCGGLTLFPSRDRVRSVGHDKRYQVGHEGDRRGDTTRRGVAARLGSQWVGLPSGAGAGVTVRCHDRQEWHRSTQGRVRMCLGAGRTARERLAAPSHRS